MMDNTSSGSWDFNLISKMFDRIYGRYKSIVIGLAGVYQMDYIYGVQAKRKRSKHK